MNYLIGFLIILIAGFFQGTFVLPMTMTKKWKWEHIWFTFSLLGMIVLNWILTLIFIPSVFDIYSQVPIKEILILSLFGLGWGIGAVLFGIGMDKLGMSLGYPIIMGLIASLGFLIPLVIFFPTDILSLKGLFLLTGTLVVIFGIVLCSQAAAKKEKSDNTKNNKFTSGIIIAIAAGILSCFPNVGMAFGKSTIEIAKSVGTSDVFAGNTVWALFFTMGFIPNAIYTVFLMSKNKNLKEMSNSFSMNSLMGFLMAAMWIGSFYLYGISASKLGNWGPIIGWPIFIALSIFIGNIWGISRGEWKGASKQARNILNFGLVVFLLAIIVIGLSNLF